MEPGRATEETGPDRDPNDVDAEAQAGEGEGEGEGGRGPGAPGLEAPPAGAPARTAAEICRDVRPGLRARRLLTGELKPGEYLARLVERRLFADAIRYMAHALLNREAVWWACLCARSETEELGALPPGEQHALGAAVRWVLEPSEARRKEAAQAALAASHTTPAGAAARAAAFALGQADAPAPGDPPPNPVHAARLAASGVLLAAGRGPAPEASARLRRSITLGLDVAYSNNRWD